MGFYGENAGPLTHSTREQSLHIDLNEMGKSFVSIPRNMNKFEMMLDKT